MSRRLLQVRVTDEEKAELEARAEQAGLSVSVWARGRLLESPAPRGRRPGERINGSGGSGAERAAASSGVSSPAGFRCPETSCGFRSLFRAAQCPVHGRKVVEE